MYTNKIILHKYITRLKDTIRMASHSSLWTNTKFLEIVYECLKWKFTLLGFLRIVCYKIFFSFQKTFWGIKQPSDSINTNLDRFFIVYEKFQATIAKVARETLIYGSNFSATKATYEVSQNMGNFVESLYIREVDVSQSNFM